MFESFSVVEMLRRTRLASRDLYISSTFVDSVRAQLEDCFNEFGEVLEVFVIASQAQSSMLQLRVLRLSALRKASKAASGVGCAFVRMAS